MESWPSLTPQKHDPLRASIARTANTWPNRWLSGAHFRHGLSSPDVQSPCRNYRFMQVSPRRLTRRQALQALARAAEGGLISTGRAAAVLGRNHQAAAVYLSRNTHKSIQRSGNLGPTVNGSFFHSAVSHRHDSIRTALDPRGILATANSDAFDPVGSYLRLSVQLLSKGVSALEARFDAARTQDHVRRAMRRAPRILVAS